MQHRFCQTINILLICILHLRCCSVLRKLLWSAYGIGPCWRATRAVCGRGEQLHLLALGSRAKEIGFLFEPGCHLLELLITPKRKTQRSHGAGEC